MSSAWSLLCLVIIFICKENYIRLPGAGMVLLYTDMRFLALRGDCSGLRLQK